MRPVSSVSRAPQRNHHSARGTSLRTASVRGAASKPANDGVWTKLK